MEVSSQFNAVNAVISLDGQYIASYADQRCVLRSASLKVIQTYKMKTIINSVSISPDSEHVLCYSTSNEIPEIKLFSFELQEPVASITPGIEGFHHAAWLTDVDLIVWSDFNIRVTIWRLQDGVVRPLTHMQYPKQSARAGWSLRAIDKRYLASGERRNGQDVISLYDGWENWALVKRFDSATSDMANLCFSPCGQYIATWESPLESQLFVYSLDGRLLCTFNPPTTTGLGIRTVVWHPETAYLVIGDYSSEIHLISPLTWTRILSFSLLPTSSSSTTHLHKPPNNDWLSLTRGYAILPFPIDPTAALSSILSRSSSTHKKPSNNNKSGISQLEISTKHLAVRTDLYPHHVFIYSLSPTTTRERKGLKTVIEYSTPVTGMSWRPKQGGEGECEALVIACGIKGIGLWFADGSKSGRAEGMGVPSKSELEIKRIEWSADGAKLLLKGKSTFCVAYPIAADGTSVEG